MIKNLVVSTGIWLWVPVTRPVCIQQASDVCVYNKCQVHRRDTGTRWVGIRVPSRLELNWMCVGGGRGFPSFLSLGQGMLGKREHRAKAPGQDETCAPAAGRSTQSAGRTTVGWMQR